MKIIEPNLNFMPNSGEENFMPPTEAKVKQRLREQESADFPDLNSLRTTHTRHSKEGMVPIRDKSRR